MLHFKDYLRDLHQADKIEQEFDEWTEELGADRLWIFFIEYINVIKNPAKIWKIAYIVLSNQ